MSGARRNRKSSPGGADKAQGRDNGGSADGEVTGFTAQQKGTCWWTGYGTAVSNLVLGFCFHDSVNDRTVY